MDNATVQNLLSMNLFKELGIEHLSPEEQIIFAQKMGETIQARILLRFLKEIAEEKKGELDRVIESENFDLVLQTVSELLPNYEEIINEEIARYKKEIIERYNQK